MRSLPLITLFLLPMLASAQPDRPGCHYFRNLRGPVHAPLTDAERAQIDETIARSDTFDILHYDIALDLTDYNGQTIKGATTVTFTARMADQAFIRFDLLDLTVDSVVDAGGPMSFGYDGQFLRVDLEEAPLVGEEHALMVYYHGHPRRDPQWGGFYFASNYMYNLGIGISTIPPNFGKVWYPCFDSFVERASYTYHVKSAGTFRLHGQGTFLGEVQLGGDTVVRSYDLAQEIPTHLSAIAVADYAEHTYIHTGANGDIPVVLSAKPADLPNMVARFGDLGSAIDACEYWYGPYAYERVGYVLTTDGALEIPTNVAYPQSMTSQSIAGNRSLLTHELGHHWWGDVVTPHIHNDMWLKEGPAEYSSHLIEEWINGRAAFVQVVKNNLLDIMSTAHIDDGGFQALSPMPDPYIYGTHTYNKGAAVMHNLRGYLGDEVFRTAMREVQLQYANTDITAEGFRDALEAVTGVDLHSFFQDWVFSPGYAVFEVRSWSAQQNGAEWDVDLTIGQKLYGTTGLHHDVPLDLTLLAADGTVQETRITVGGLLQNVQVQCPFEPAMVVLNRYQRLNQARMDNEITLVPGQSFINNIPYVEFRVYANTLVDTTLVRVDHIWSDPDPMPVAPNITAMGTRRYWNVDGLWPEGTSLQGRIFYFGGTPAQFDHDLIAGDETGIVMVHRASAEVPWEVYPDQTVNTGSLTNGAGSITLNTLQKGQYALAKTASTVSVPEGDSGAFALFPVPTDRSLTVRLDVPSTDMLFLDVFATDGKLVQRTTRGSGTAVVTLETGDLPDGNYVLRIGAGTGTIGARRFEIVR